MACSATGPYSISMLDHEDGDPKGSRTPATSARPYKRGFS
jgi:hypothetical protein